MTLKCKLENGSVFQVRRQARCVFLSLWSWMQKLEKNKAIEAIPPSQSRFGSCDRALAVDLCARVSLVVASAAYE